MSDERLRSCPLCGTTFEKRSELTKHLRKGDDAHQLLVYVHELVNYAPTKIPTIMDDYVKAFNCLKATNDLERAKRLAAMVKQKADEAAKAKAEAELNKVTCPLCKTPCGTAQKLLMHVRGVDDDAHRLLLKIKEISEAKQTELVDLPTTFVDAFTVLAAEGFDAAVTKAEAVHHEVMTAIANAAAGKRRATELAKHAVTTSVRYQRIAREAEEYERLISERELVKREESRRFAHMPKNDKPGALVDYFYNLTGGKPFIVRDVPLVKSLYTKYRLTADQIRGVLKYMYLIGERSLAHVTKLVDDGLAFTDRIAEMDTQGTPASLVKLFYTLRNAKPMARFFVREERMIATALRDGRVDFAQAEQLVRQLASQPGCPLLYFESRAAAGVKTTPQANNPCVVYTVDREVSENARNVIAGRLKLSDVSAGIRDRVTAEVDKVYIAGEFDKRYAHTEWAFKIGLPLTPARLDVAKQAKRDSWFTNALAKCTDAAKLTKIKALQAEYTAWLQQQTACVSGGI